MDPSSSFVSANPLRNHQPSTEKIGYKDLHTAKRSNSGAVWQGTSLRQLLIRSGQKFNGKNIVLMFFNFHEFRDYNLHLMNDERLNILGKAQIAHTD